MEKIFQILIVFALMIFAITWFIRGRERKYREYSFSGRFTFPLSGDWSRDLITVAVVRPGERDVVALQAPGEEGDVVTGAEKDVLTVTEEARSAVDAENHLFFRRGRDKTLEIVDEANGVLAGTVALEWSADAILFDPGSRLIFCGSVEGAVTIIRQVLPDLYKTVQRLAVPRDCTALSLDSQSGKLYVHIGTSVFIYTNT
jgi:hypothetical protein